MSKEKEAKEIAKEILKPKSAKLVEPFDIEKPPKDIYFKELTFTHIGTQEDKTGRNKIVIAEDVDYYVTNNPQFVCPSCGTDRFVYLVPAITGVCKVCLRCSTTQGILSKEFGISRKKYRMSPEEAIEILKKRGATRRTLASYQRLTLEKPFRIPRKRPKSKR